MARRARSRARSRAAARRSSVFALSMAVKLATNTWRVPLSVGIPACVTSPAKRSAVPDEGCNHLSSDVIRCHQRSSEVIRGHQRSSEVCIQRYAIRGMQSEVIRVIRGVPYRHSEQEPPQALPTRSFQIRSFQIRNRRPRARDYPWAKSPCRPQRRSHLHARREGHQHAIRAQRKPGPPPR